MRRSRPARNSGCEPYGSPDLEKNGDPSGTPEGVVCSLLVSVEDRTSRRVDRRAAKATNDFSTQDVSKSRCPESPPPGQNPWHAAPC